LMLLTTRSKMLKVTLLLIFSRFWGKRIFQLNGTDSSRSLVKKWYKISHGKVLKHEDYRVVQYQYLSVPTVPGHIIICGHTFHVTTKEV
jgi:hypothetical protein